MSCQTCFNISCIFNAYFNREILACADCYRSNIVNLTLKNLIMKNINCNIYILTRFKQWYGFLKYRSSQLES